MGDFQVHKNVARNRMSAYKPKIYRSQEGCCICKAKSSSSRFTDSGKYEDACQECFKLEETRRGEICNACVLIVKRWKKLPRNTSKNWAHVVDARTGPGTKNIFKQKKKESPVVPFVEKPFKYKHVYKRKPPPPPPRRTRPRPPRPPLHFPPPSRPPPSRVWLRRNSKPSRAWKQWRLMRRRSSTWTRARSSS